MIILKWLFRALPFFYMTLIWILSGLPDNVIVDLPDSKVDRILKESLHLIEFAILYLLLVAAVFTTNRFSNKFHILLAVFAALYGIVDEIHQSFVPYRTASLIDVVKDITGVFIAYIVIHQALNGRFPRLKKGIDTFKNIFN